MNGNSILIDTNIALYLLNGNRTILSILNQNTIYISFITQIELLSWKGITKDELENIKSFVSDCIIIDLTDEIKQNAITLRKNYNIKLPDCIIAASAMCFDFYLFFGRSRV